MSRVAGRANSSKTKLVGKFKYLFLVMVILTSGFLILITNKDIRSFDSIFNNETTSMLKPRRYDDTEDRFTIYTEGCSIPALNVLDKSIREYVKYPKTLKLCNLTRALLKNNREKIWVENQNVKYYTSGRMELTCCYSGFYRPNFVDDVTSDTADDRVKYMPCKKFIKSIKVKDEFVRVICFAGSKEVYKQYFAFAPLKPFTRYQNENEIPYNKSGYNVLVLGIDAVSRLNFHRTMPRTANYLRESGAVELVGYNKVGDNTFPNLIPMLMGLNVTELKKTCLPHNFVNFDNCPFVWEWFKQAGYYTAFGEDSSELGMFNYLKSGFIKSPTDYYLHTFINEAKLNVGNNKDFNVVLCMGDKYFYKVFLHYIQDLTITLQQKRMFGFFWEITMSHDYLTYPMIMDDDYVELLSSLEASEYLSKTVLLLTSDHGIRWGQIRETKQGRLEERLPLTYILTPLSFRKNFKLAYSNLKLNSKRLTTPFDVHATLTDLIDLENLKDEVIAERTNKSYSNDRSISLFLPITSNRTCRMAYIEDHWCTCHKETKLAKNDPTAVEAASVLVTFLNSMLKNYPQCMKLELSEIVYVLKLEAGNPETDERTWNEFLVVIKAYPGGGVFEATLKLENEEWALAGTPSRTNLYGEQSRCVNQYQVKLYCYCRN